LPAASVGTLVKEKENMSIVQTSPLQKAAGEHFSCSSKATEGMTAESSDMGELPVAWQGRVGRFGQRFGLQSAREATRSRVKENVVSSRRKYMHARWLM
jgi:hypothetical protein